MGKLIVGHIDYINTIPVDAGRIDPGIEENKVPGPPARINQLLLEGRVDVGFISAAFFLQNEHRLVRLSDFVIASQYRAMSVMLFARYSLFHRREVPVALYETPDSATSVFLNRILMEFYMGAKFNRTKREEADALLLIGDEALNFSDTDNFPFRYDVGLNWFSFTGLPAVFAVLAASRQAWEAKRAEIESYLQAVQEVHQQSVDNISGCIRLAKKRVNLPDDVLKLYYHSLRYRTTDEMEQSIRLMKRFMYGNS